MAVNSTKTVPKYLLFYWLINNFKNFCSNRFSIIFVINLYKYDKSLLFQFFVDRLFYVEGCLLLFHFSKTIPSSVQLLKRFFASSNSLLSPFLFWKYRDFLRSFIIFCEFTSVLCICCRYSGHLFRFYIHNYSFVMEILWSSLSK